MWDPWARSQCILVSVALVRRINNSLSKSDPGCVRPQLPLRSCRTFQLVLAAACRKQRASVLFPPLHARLDPRYINLMLTHIEPNSPSYACFAVYTVRQIHNWN